MAELVDALDSKSSDFGRVGSIPTLSTQRDKSSFLDLSLFLFFLFTLLKRAILCKSSIKELMIDGISKDYAKSPITLVEIF